VQKLAEQDAGGDGNEMGVLLMKEILRRQDAVEKRLDILEKKQK
jgi:hypothetical protein